MYDPLSESLVQHLPVPLLKPFGLGDLLIRRVAVENVVISFTGRAGPDVTCHIPKWPQDVSASQHLQGMMNAILTAGV